MTKIIIGTLCSLTIALITSLCRYYLTGFTPAKSLILTDLNINQPLIAMVLEKGIELERHKVENKIKRA